MVSALGGYVQILGRIFFWWIVVVGREGQLLGRLKRRTFFGFSAHCHFNPARFGCGNSSRVDWIVVVCFCDDTLNASKNRRAHFSECIIY